MIIAEVLNNKGSDVTTIDETRTVANAIALLAERKIGAVIVVDAAGQVSGIFSERDVVRLLNEHGATALENSLASRMTRHPVTCTRGDSVADVLETMSKLHFRHMPVFDNGALCGMVSIRDLVVERLQKCEIEAEEIRAYVASA
jgi:CBS domain-containing protein